MASSSSGIFKALLVIVFVGIVFYGLNWLLQPVSETADSADAAVASTETEVIEDPASAMTPEEAEAARYGAEIGRLVGADIGRQVGLAAIAGLQAAGVEPGTVEMAIEDEEVDEVEEAAPMVAAKPKPEPTPEPKPEPKPAVVAKPEAKPAPVVVAKPEPAAPPPAPEPAAAEPTVAATTAEPEPSAPAPAETAPEAAMTAQEDSAVTTEAAATETTADTSTSSTAEAEVVEEPVVKKNRRRWLPNRTSPRPYH